MDMERKNKYVINDQYTFRLEYFGGLVLSQNVEDKFIISKETYIFLKAYEKFTLDESIGIVSNIIGGKYEPEFEELIETKMLVYQENTLLEIPEKIPEFISKIQEELRNVEGKSSLLFPLYISIYPTPVCQAFCKFCYFKDKGIKYSKKENEFVSINYWKNVIDEILQYHGVGLSILGGEPTLYKDIDELLKYAIERKIKASLTTNGLFMKESTFDILTTKDQFIISMSLQGIGEIHHKLTGIDFESVERRVKMFIKKGIIPQINTVITEQSIEDFERILDWCEYNGIEEVFLNLYNTLEENTEKYKMNDYKSLEYRLNQYILRKKYTFNLTFVGCLYYSAFYDENYQLTDPEFEKIFYGCEAGKTKIEIMPNGDVFPCVLMEHPIGNIKDQSVYDIWNKSAILGKMRTMRNKDERCINCSFYVFCNGGCPVRNEKNFYLKGDERCAILALL